MLAAVDGKADEHASPQQSTQMDGENSTQQAANEPSPRLIIQQIVMENFKSYAGRQVIGPFHKVPPDHAWS